MLHEHEFDGNQTLVAKGHLFVIPVGKGEHLFVIPVGKEQSPFSVLPPANCSILLLTLEKLN